MSKRVSTCLAACVVGLVWTVGLLSLDGCLGGGGGGRPDEGVPGIPGVSGRPQTFDDLRTELAAVACGKIEQCCGNSRSFTLAECIEVYKEDWDLYNGELSISEGLATYDEDAGSRCVAAVAEAANAIACDAFIIQRFMPAVPDRIQDCRSAIAGTQNEGEQCAFELGDGGAGWDSDEVCKEGMYCDYMGSRECTSFTPIGERCVQSGCIREAFCDRDESVCKEKLAEGRRCSVSSDCLSNACGDTNSMGESYCVPFDEYLEPVCAGRRNNSDK